MPYFKAEMHHGGRSLQRSPDPLVGFEVAYFYWEGGKGRDGNESI